VETGLALRRNRAPANTDAAREAERDNEPTRWPGLADLRGAGVGDLAMGGGSGDVVGDMVSPISMEPP
jgi:hypothetical protein